MKLEQLVKDAPSYYGKCILKDCTASAICLRYLLYQQRAKESRQLTIVNPDFAQPQKGENCPCFRSLTPVRMARGFQNALRTVPHGNIKQVQQELIYHFCRTMFYYYRKGDRMLSPKEQKYVSDVLIRFGAKEPITFDAYEEGYVWNED